MRNARLAILAATSILTVSSVVVARDMRAPANAPAIRLEKSPLSGGVLMARALRSGAVALPRAPVPDQAPTLKCKPRPCALPDVQASGGGNPVNETPISIDPGDRKHVLTAGNDYNCSTLQGYYLSADGGSTWTRSCGTLAAGATGGLGDPVVGWDLNGIAYRGGINVRSDGSYEIVVAHSADLGQTWSTPAIAVQKANIDMDKPWLEIDTNPNSPLKNTLYVSATQFDGSNNSQIAVSHSGDGGATWQAVNVDQQQIYPNIDQFSDLAIGADGTVYVSWMRCSATGPTGDCGGTTASMWVAKSADGGATWSAPVKIHDADLAPDSCGAFYGCLPNTFERVSNIPVIAIDNSAGAKSGTLYVADYDWTGTHMQVEVTSSADGGTTWSRTFDVVPDGQTHDQFFPWINVGGDGRIGLTWLDRRDDPSNVNYNAYGAASKKLKGLKNANVRLSSQSSNPFEDGFGSGFMGDYTGNAWESGRNILMMSWADTRSHASAQDEVGGLKP